MHLRQSILLWSWLFLTMPTLAQPTDFSVVSMAYEQNEVTLRHEVSLKKLLRQFETNYDIFIFYESDILTQINIPAFQFNFSKSIEYNLQLALSYTNLTYKKVSSSTYIIIKIPIKGVLYGRIVEKNAQPLIGATIQLLDNKGGVATDLDGQFRLPLSEGEHKISVSYVGYKPVYKTVAINSEDSIQLNLTLNDCTTFKEVVIVGSHFKAAPLIEKVEPADVINQAKVETLNQFEVGQLLQYTVPSFHSTPQTISDGTDHINPATLRGLGPDQVLVLVNGKRRHSSALVNVNGTVGRGSVATDLNAIPLSAIEKIEVLRDGAAAQYGSDAIAGVINIVLKKEIRYTEINTFSGINQEGDGATFQVNSSHGISLGKKGGFASVALDFRKKNHTNRSGNYTGMIYGDARDENEVERQRFFEQTGFDNQRVMSIGNAASTNAAAFINAELPINQYVTLYGFGGVNYRLGESYGFYRFPYQRRRQSGIFPLGFSPKIKADIFDRSLTLGVKSKNLPWQIDFSNTVGGNRFDFRVENSNNASMGLASPTSAYSGGFNYTQNVTNLNVSKQTFWKVPIQVEFGAEFRLENYQQLEGEEASWEHYGDTTLQGEFKEGGMQVFPGFMPQNATDQFRHNLGFYTNVDVELSKSWLLNVAGRYEYYSDFGSSLIYKIGTRYTVSPSLTLRSTFNTGFRAPSMPQIHYSGQAIQFISVEDEQVGVKVSNFKNDSPITRQFGIEPLKAETSRNYSVGLTLNVLDNLSLTSDVFQINIQDRIVLTGLFSAEDDPRFAEILNPTGVYKAQFFTNAIDTRTKGVDIVLNYQFDFEKSRLKCSIGGNITQTRLKTDAQNRPIIRTSEVLQGFESILFNREEISRIEVAQPQSKLILNLNYIHSKFEANLTTTRFGSISYIHPKDGNSNHWILNQLTNQIESRDQIFNAKWITNLNLLYRFSNRFTVHLGGNNIFNIYPDQHTHSANINNGLFLYSRRVQQFGVSGAFWYGRLNWRF